jgi:light-regulated signal transduction histidine kinase (bacteriophytochrome)
MFELLSNVISAKISSIQHKEKFDFLNDLREKRSKLIDQTYTEKSLSAGLLGYPINVMDLFAAGGVALVQNGTIDSIGVIPKLEEIKNLVMWLQNKEVAKVYAEASLASEYHYASEFTKQASGMLAIAMDKDKGNYLLAFRPEVVTTVNWGGNPDEAINFESDGKKYHPRNSFRLWQEEVTNTSVKWHSDELQIADELRSFIFEYSSKFLSN